MALVPTAMGVLPAKEYQVIVYEKGKSSTLCFRLLCSRSFGLPTTISGEPFLQFDVHVERLLFISNGILGLEYALLHS